MNDRARTDFRANCRNWKLYAAAAGASVAAGTSADAGIVYSGSLNVKAEVTGGQGNSSTAFNINGYQLKISIAKSSYTNAGFTYFRATARLNIPTGNLVGFRNGTSYVSTLRKFGQGNPISISSPGLILQGNGILLRAGAGTNYGNFQANGTGFAGFSMVGGKLGWIKVKLTQDTHGIPTSATILGWAYNNVAGGAINAGQTSGPSAVPEPGTMAMGLLASGAGGLVALRKAKKRAHDEQAAA